MIARLNKIGKYSFDETHHYLNLHLILLVYVRAHFFVNHLSSYGFCSSIDSLNLEFLLNLDSQNRIPYRKNIVLDSLRTSMMPLYPFIITPFNISNIFSQYFIIIIDINQIIQIYQCNIL